MVRTKHILLSFGLATLWLLALISVSACSDGGGTATVPGLNTDPSISDGGSVAGGDTSISSGTEACSSSEPGSISTTSINFGLNELDSVTCQTINVTPSCASFSAEIDSSSDADEFVIESSDGTESTDRTTGEGSFSVCYKRPDVGSFTGRVNVVIVSNSKNYAFTISLSGQTVGALFNITSPNPDPNTPQLVWENDGVSTYDSSTSKFSLTASGTLNADLKSIFSSSTLTIKAGGKSQTVTFGSDYSFAATIQIPSTPAAVYPVDFSIDTTQGTLTKTVNVIRYINPVGSLEVQDGSGNLVSSVVDEDTGTTTDPTQTDSTSLIAGLNLNLDVSGPRSSYPDKISLSITRSDGTQLKYDASQAAGAHWVDQSASPDSISFYLDAYDFGETTGEQGLCTSNFGDPTMTYCFYLPPTAELGKGTNVVTATICNSYTDSMGSGCSTATTSIVVDNDTPIITINTPTENGVYAEGDTITVTGTIENFAPTSTTSTATDNGGSTTTVTTTACDTKLWVNTSIIQTAIDLCDKITVVQNTDGNLTTGNKGNTRKATFSVDLSTNGDDSGYHKLTLYTNMLYIQAKNSSGHSAYAVKTFQRGSYNASTFKTSRSGSGSLSSSLGSALGAQVKSMSAGVTGDLTTGQLGTLSNLDGSTQGTPIMLNISEGTLTKPEVVAVLKKFVNDNVPFDQLAMGLLFGTDIVDKNGNITSIPVPQNSDEILTMLHGSAPEQLRALWTYQDGDPSKYFSSEDAQDACGNPMTTLAITPDVYQYLLPSYSPTYLNEWPTAICGDNLDCRIVEQGRWDVNIDLKDDGFIDLDLVLSPKAEGEPAFFAYFTFYNLIEQGTTGAYTTHGAGVADPTFPAWMNFGRVTVHLKDALRFIKAKKNTDGSIAMCQNVERMDEEPCACDGISECTNMLYVYQSRLDSDDTTLMDTVRFEPYTQGCIHFHSLFPDAEMPAGCDTTDTLTENTFFIDVTSKTGYNLWNNYGDLFVTPSLKLFDKVFAHTLVNTVSCIGRQALNPLIDPVAFPYPSWVPADKQVTDLTMALDNASSGVTVDLAKDAENPLFTFTPNLKDADINIFNGGLTLKLPISMGASGISSNLLSTSSSTKRNNGFMYRAPSDADFEDAYPPHDVTTQPYIGASVGLEEFGNAAFHVLFKKGLKDVLDLISTGLSDKLDMTNNWTIGLDKVVLGRMGDTGICGISVLSTDLKLLFGGIPNFITGSALHLDISLDKNYPPTLALQPVDGDPYAAILQVGLTNVQIDVKNLDDQGDNTFSIGSSIVKVRGDLMVKVLLRYSPESRRLEIYLMPLNETPIYFTVVNRGFTYDDYSVVTGINDTILPAVWPTLSASYDPANTTNTPSFAMRFPDTVTGFSNTVSVTTADDATTAEADPTAFVSESYITASPATECEDGSQPQYATSSGSFVSGFISKITSFMSAVEATVASVLSSTSSSVPHIVLSPVSFNPGNTPHLLDTSDPCFWMGGVGSTSLAKTLCGYGIEDISFGDGYPDLQFDYTNGYVHLSTELLVQVYDWLGDEVSTE